MSRLIRESVGDRVFLIINFILITMLFLIIAYPLYFVIIASISDVDYVSTGRVILYPIGINFDRFVAVSQVDHRMAILKANGRERPVLRCASSEFCGVGGELIQNPAVR